ncbi:hypothetical protein Tco_1581057, partial [Tanacetum coccineum]
MNKSVATPHKKTVASDTTTQKPKSYFKELYENKNQAWKWWIGKKCPSGKLLNSCTGKVDSEPMHGSIVDIPHIHACKQTLDLSAETSARMVSQKMKSSQKTFEHSSSSLDRQCQKTFEHNSSSLDLKCQKTFKHSSSSLGRQCQMTSVHISLGLVLHQMTSDHNRSELGIHDHSNE